MNSDSYFVEAFLQNSRANLFVCDCNMKILQTNQRMRKDLPEFIPGQLLPSFFPEQTHIFDQALQKLRKGLAYTSPLLPALQGQAVLTLVPVFQEEILSVILCSLELLKEAPRLYSGELSAFSERCRAPISNVVNALYYLKEQAIEEEEYDTMRLLNESLRNCYRILREIFGMKHYYDLTSGRQKWSPKWINLSETMLNLCRLLQLRLSSSGRVWEYEVPDEAILIQGDESLLSLAVLNLVANSCNFSPEGSLIRLTLSRQGDSAHLTIFDEGDGIPPKDLERIFEPFYIRHSDPVPEERLGLGLGLPIVKQIVELHGGSILVTSEEYQGTAVAITLPLTNLEGQTPPLHNKEISYLIGRYSELYILLSDICEFQYQ